MRYFISTSIPYTNSDPHIGFFWELLLADCYSQFQRLRNNEVFFLSGTDENGLKIYRSAERENLPIKEFVDKIANKFFKLKDKFGIQWNNFIRTSSPEHQQGVRKFWQLVGEDIYSAHYDGLYCVGCEDYYKPGEFENNICPWHQKKLERFKEKNYFFKLTKYLPQVQELIESGKLKVVPENRKHETLNIIKSGQISDLSVSRSIERSAGWGIKVPGDETQVVYVWFDALVNYVTGLGFGGENESNFEKFWQNSDKIVHFVGKDIFKFHTVYWPAMLLAAGLKTPDFVVVHDFITVDGQKISKTIGNVIEPDDLLKKYDREVIRYYFLSQFSQFEDMNFTWQNLEETYQGELKKEIGNFASRVFGLLQKAAGKFSLDEKLDKEIREIDKEWTINLQVYLGYFEEFKFKEAFGAAFNLVKLGNRFIEENKVWQSQNVSDFRTLVNLLFNIARMYQPIMPEASKKIFEALGFEYVEDLNNKIFINKKINFQPLF
jgi:methionyl-tRNA synthetase